MSNQKISLNGTWKLRWYDGQRGGNVQRLLVANPELHRALRTVPPEPDRGIRQILDVDPFSML